MFEKSKGIIWEVVKGRSRFPDTRLAIELYHFRVIFRVILCCIYEYNCALFSKTLPNLICKNPSIYKGYLHLLGFINNGDNRTRTCDPLHVKQMLSQLSYVSIGAL